MRSSSEAHAHNSWDACERESGEFIGNGLADAVSTLEAAPSVSSGAATSVSFEAAPSAASPAVAGGRCRSSIAARSSLASSCAAASSVGAFSTQTSPASLKASRSRTSTANGTENSVALSLELDLRSRRYFRGSSSGGFFSSMLRRSVTSSSAASLCDRCRAANRLCTSCPNINVCEPQVPEDRKSR
eukprot:862929-Prymnesium_polylepis.1